MALKSIKSIAAHLHLSTATVSWVLSGKGDEKRVSKSTQQRVLAYTQEIGYHPNLLARALNVGRSNTVGLIVPSITNTFYSGIAREIEHNLDEADYSLMICSSDSYGDNERRIVDIMRGHQTDGIIIAPTKQNRDVIDGLVADDFPLVLIDRYFPDLPTNTILADNQESSYQLVNHMIERGARRVAVITTNLYLTVMQHRLNGYIDALRSHGLPIDPKLIKEISFHGYEKGVPLVLDELFTQVTDVDGIFFTNHWLASEAFLYFSKHHIDFNSRFHLASIHAEPLFRMVAPKMDVAIQPIREIGLKAVEMLLRQIDRKFDKASPKGVEDAEHLVLPCKIEYGE